jgi:hypothetical protein
MDGNTVAEKLASELRDLAASGNVHGIDAVRLIHNAADELERQVAWLRNETIL